MVWKERFHWQLNKTINTLDLGYSKILGKGTQRMRVQSGKDTIFIVCSWYY